MKRGITSQRLWGWRDFRATSGDTVSVVTGHLAVCLAWALADPAGRGPVLRGQALAAARSLVEDG